jgi:glycosyltransferase involved in cell wall biosynthesis
MSDRVRFTGPIYDPKQISEAISRSQLGIALYDKKTDQFTKFADATKLKTYLGSGTPILTTDVPFNAKALSAEGVAFLTECDTLSVANALKAFFSSDTKMKDISKRCLSYASRYDWNKIYDDAF